MPYVDALVAAGERVTPPAPPSTAASAEESTLVLRWLEQPGVRLVQLDGEWSQPIHGASAAWHRHQELVGAT